MSTSALESRDRIAAGALRAVSRRCCLHCCPPRAQANAQKPAHALSLFERKYLHELRCKAHKKANQRSACATLADGALAFALAATALAATAAAAARPFLARRAICQISLTFSNLHLLLETINKKRSASWPPFISQTCNSCSKR